MALDLNETIEPYKEFYGKNTEQMPLLISGRNAEGEIVDISRVPLSVAGLMDRRLNSPKTAWRTNYFDTGDAIAYSAGGDKIKIVLDSQNLRSITAKSELKNNALLLGDGVYETLQGQEFKRSDLTLENDLSAADVKAHPFWKALARDDARLNEYVDKMFAAMKADHGYETAMGVYLASGEKVPTMRAACVDGLGLRSRLYGGGVLGYSCGRLVGVAPEALSAPNQAIVRPSLETALAIVNQHAYQGKIELRAKQ